MDFQSIALPTELYHHPYWWGQRYKPFFIIQYAIVFFFVIYLCTMTELKNTLIIDAGNTSVKVTLFIDNQLKSIERFRFTEIESLKEHLTKLNYSDVAISSVLSDLDTKILMELFPKAINITSHSIHPVKMGYETPQTLGIDRLANVSAIVPLLKTKYGVVIDIGTCIKFDIADNQGNYFGGSISPGIKLRYKSLNDYTGKLPLLESTTSCELVGTTTQESIQSGVINGIHNELLGFMAQYHEKFEDLTFFVTGGDADYFELDRKFDIFADKNLTLKGIFEIYKYNA